MKTILSIMMLFVLIGITGHSQDSIVGKYRMFPQIKGTGIDTAKLYYGRPGDCVLPDSIITRDRREFSQRYAVVKIEKKPIITPLFIAGCASWFISGLSDGSMQTLDHSPQRFEKLWNCPAYRCDPALTWTNKYKNHDPKQGAKFLGSTSFLVWTTDKYHGIQMGRNLFLTGGLVFNLADIHSNRKWYVIAGKAIISWICFDSGRQASFWIYNYKH
jgi:hypothetical protein